MEINNFQLIKSILTFETPQDCYLIQILQRNKDGNSKTKLRKYYLVKSMDQYNNIQKDIINLCNLYNARAYIIPAKKRLERINKVYTQTVMNTFINHSESLNGSEYIKACNDSFTNYKSVYIIDIDTKDTDILNTCMGYLEFSNSYTNDNVPVEILAVIPTLQGNHILCAPFNTHKYVQDLLMKNIRIDIHKNNPTLLYFNPKK